MDELLFHQLMPVNMAVIVFGCYGNSAKILASLFVIDVAPESTYPLHVILSHSYSHISATNV